MAQSHQHLSTLMAEGGEGGEAGPATAVSDEEALVVLAQMQGHLLVAQELLGQQQFSAAEPHVGHPIDELYGALDPALQSRQIPGFLPTLDELRQQVRLNPQAPATRTKLAEAQQAISAAAQVMRGFGTAATASAVVKQLAQTAVQEYEAAIAGDRVVEVIEYQDARGFLLEAQRLLSTAMASQPASAQRLGELQQTITAMLRAAPTAVPPGKALMSVAELQQLQGQL
jgi:hypothetical protein